MRKIGFKNFRRFKNMDAIELGGVNMFVGGNNAGKSTVVKALLLVVDFLKNTKFSDGDVLQNLKFKFDSDGAHDINVDTFKRALCWDADNEEITFNLSFAHYDVELTVYNASNFDTSWADVKTIKVVDNSQVVTFVFHFDNKLIDMIIGKNEDVDVEISELESKIQLAKQMIARYEVNMQEATNHPEKTSFEDVTHWAKCLDIENTELNRFQSRIDVLKKVASENVLNFPLSSLKIVSNENESFLTSIFRALYNYISSIKIKSSGKSNLINEKIEEIAQLIYEVADHIGGHIACLNLEYIYAHSATQQVLYNKKDGNDYVSKSIQEFYNQRITAETEEGQLVMKWIHDFGCTDADSYILSSVEGEAYKFSFMKNERSLNLADMGRGTVQLTVLFVRLASLIKKYRNSLSKPIVLVEEPEQNLHPSVQSKLTALFESIYLNYGIRFIIETHSEYLVRNSQLGFARSVKHGNVSLDEMNQRQKVYFFPKLETPYLMGYQQNGRFEESFRENGFFDEAGRINRELNLLERS